MTIDSLFTNVLIGTSIVTGALTIKARAGAFTNTPTSSSFKAFQVTFLLIYYVAMTADWLQGPYVYALYSSYGFSGHDIAVLFVGGFGASMVFGTFVGAMADKMGRKRACQLYCLLYFLSCVTKHAKDYWVLMLGRVLGGVATSLLFSSFESWMICEHTARGYEGSAMGDTFSLMYFGNSICAIVAGMMAESAADLKALTPTDSPPWYYGGYTAPFDLSAFFLIVGFGLISGMWNENYGEGSRDKGENQISHALAIVYRDPGVLMTGVIVSLFEGCMYIFVFNWTPSISAHYSKPPFGFIFATFMVACMGGSSLFSVLSKTMAPENMLVGVFAVGSVALAVPVFTGATLPVLCAFLVFEACVGIYWPAMGTVKSKVVPEEARATIYNIYRVPLNGVVLGILLNDMKLTTAFTFCSLMLAVAAVTQSMLSKRVKYSGKESGDMALGKIDDGKAKLMDSNSDE